LTRSPQTDPVEARLAAIVQSSFDAIVGKRPDGTITSWNPAATELFGWSPEEIVGRSIDAMIPSDRHREETEMMARVADGERVDPYETERLIKGGATIQVVLTSSPIRSSAGDVEGVASIYRDNGWIKRREGVLRALLEAAHDAIVGVDPSGVIQVVNSRAEELFGYTRDELIGQLVDVLVPVRVEDIQAEDLNGGGNHASRPTNGGLVLTARNKDGRDFPVDIALSSQETEEGIIGVSVRDISDAVRVSREKELLEQRLGRSRLESLGQLVGGIAHDFNNLLAGIMGFSTLAQDELREITRRDPGDAVAQVAKDVDQIVEATERAEILTRQLLRFGRQDVVQPQALDVNQIVLGMEDLLRRTIGEEIRFVTQLDSPLGSVHMDPSHFEQTLMNLAVNARDAMPAGGTLTVRSGETTFDTAAAAAQGIDPGKYVLLCISDTGTGMTPEVVEHAFDPYFSTKPRGEGSGLGLAAVYGVVVQAGGLVTLSSDEEGTTVDVYLPAIEDPAR
jgi:PAS domain S-box-containing protein